MAAEYYRQRCEVAAAYAAADPRNANWRRDLAAAETTYAGVLRLLGSWQEAGQAYQRAIAILRPIVEAAPDLRYGNAISQMRNSVSG